MSDKAYVDEHEGEQMLGVSRANFYYYVRSGKIRKKPGTSKPDTLYSVADILAVKNRRARSEQIRYDRKVSQAPVILDWLSPKDIPAILRLDQLVYDEMYLAEMDVYRQWSEKNPQLAMAAFDARSDRQTMLAYIAALPLEEEVIYAILRGERDEVSITKDEIQAYDRSGPYTLLANSAVAHPERPELLVRVLHRMMDEWVDRYPERYVTRIYTQPVSKRGDEMVQHFFMTPLYGLADNAYVLDLSRPSAARPIRIFQARLQAKAPLPEELQRSY